MAISKQQTQTLIALLASSKTDTMDCDGCYEHLAEFVEAELAEREIPEALECVRRHLEQCACCADEHQALLEAIRALDEPDDTP